MVTGGVSSLSSEVQVGRHRRTACSAEQDTLPHSALAVYGTDALNVQIAFRSLLNLRHNSNFCNDIYENAMQ